MAGLVESLIRCAQAGSPYPPSVYQALHRIEERDCCGLWDQLGWKRPGILAKATCLTVWLKSGTVLPSIQVDLPRLFNQLSQDGLLDRFPTHELAAHLLGNGMLDEMTHWTIGSAAWQLGYALHCTSLLENETYMTHIENLILANGFAMSELSRLVRAYCALDACPRPSFLRSIGQNRMRLIGVETVKYSRPSVLGSDKQFTNYMNIIMRDSENADLMYAIALSSHSMIPTSICEGSTFAELFTQKHIASVLSAGPNTTTNLSVLLIIGAKLYPTICSRLVLDSLLCVGIQVLSCDKSDRGLRVTLERVGHLLEEKGYDSDCFHSLIHSLS